jgi:hypothetical protein
MIGMGFTYRLERIEVDEILLLADLPPLGRSALKEYRNQVKSNKTWKYHDKLYIDYKFSW